MLLLGYRLTVYIGWNKFSVAEAVVSRSLISLPTCLCSVSNPLLSTKSSSLTPRLL